MTRTKSDIPIKVTCPDGKTTQTMVNTKFDFLVAGVANVIFWPAWLYDTWQDKAFNIPEISLTPYCKENSKNDPQTPAPASVN